jgi:hypothetical protein
MPYLDAVGKKTISPVHGGRRMVIGSFDGGKTLAIMGTIFLASGKYGKLFSCSAFTRKPGKEIYWIYKGI